MKKRFLIVGVILSIVSKVMQFAFDNILGDIIILIAAPFFVLSILLFIPKYDQLLKNSTTKKLAIHMAIYCCLTVLFFQLFTMLTFGWGVSFGMFFVIPLLISLIATSVSIISVRNKIGK